MERLVIDEKKKIKQIKRNVIERIYNIYAGELEEQYKSNRVIYEAEYHAGSATEHHFSEDQIALKRKEYVSRKIKDDKRKGVERILNNLINQNYGLVDDSWDIFLYPIKDVEDFLFTLVSMQYENERFIYYDKIEKDSNKYNKYLIRDLHKGSLTADVTNYCEFILQKRLYYKKTLLNEVTKIESRNAEIVRYINEGLYSWLEILEIIHKMIAEIEYHYFIKNKACQYSVMDVYCGICNSEEYLHTLYTRLYIKVIRYDKKFYNQLKEHLQNCRHELERLENKKISYVSTGFDIFQEYAWRLLWQTTVQENAVSLKIYEKLVGTPAKKIHVKIKDIEKSKINRILEWFISQNYLYYPLEKITPEIYGNLYYEIFVDKTKYRSTALVIANRILRNEYYKNGNLSEDIWFLNFKIRRAIWNLKSDEYEEYAKLDIAFIGIFQTVWKICKNNDYSPHIILDLYGRLL